MHEFTCRGAMQCGGGANCRRGWERAAGITLVLLLLSHLSISNLNRCIQGWKQMPAPSTAWISNATNVFWDAESTILGKTSISSLGHPAIVKRFQAGFRVLEFRKSISLSFINTFPWVFCIWDEIFIKEACCTSAPYGTLPFWMTGSSGMALRHSQSWLRNL